MKSDLGGVQWVDTHMLDQKEIKPQIRIFKTTDDRIKLPIKRRNLVIKWNPLWLWSGRLSYRH